MQYKLIKKQIDTCIIKNGALMLAY
jgi:hypothetical protein